VALRSGSLSLSKGGVKLETQSRSLSLSKGVKGLDFGSGATIRLPEPVEGGSEIRNLIPVPELVEGMEFGSCTSIGLPEPVEGGSEIRNLIPVPELVEGSQRVGFWKWRYDRAP
jgi:hypothetical protein